MPPSAIVHANELSALFAAIIRQTGRPGLVPLRRCRSPFQFDPLRSTPLGTYFSLSAFPDLSVAVK
jgi:hypothetical protein